MTGPGRATTRGLELAAVAALLLAPLVLMLPSLRPGWSLVPFAGAAPDAVLWDARQQDVPWKLAVVAALRAGHVPLYSAAAFCGSPLLANGQSAPLYPGNVAYLLLGAIRGLEPTLLGHLWLAAFGAALLVRRLGGSLAGAVVAGVSFSLSATLLAFLPHPQMTASLALAPWLMLALERARERPSGRRLAALATVTGLLLLAGHLQYAAFGLLVAVLMLAAMPGRRLAPALALGLGSVLGAMQLIPTLGYVADAARKPLATSGGLWGGYQHSMPLAHLPALVWPECFGRPDAGPYVGLVNARMFACSIGIVPLVLLAGGAYRSRAARLFGLVALLGLLLALGTPLYGLLHALPGWSSLKPARALALVALGGSLAAGLVLDECRLRRGLAIVAPLLLLATVPALRAATPGLLGSIAPTFVRLLLALGLVLVATRAGRRRGAIVAIACLVDLVPCAYPRLSAHQVADPYPETAEVALLRRLGERFSSPVFSHLLPNGAMARGLEDARGTDSFIPRRYHELARRLDPSSDDMVRVRLATGLARPAHALLAPILVGVAPGRARALPLEPLPLAGAFRDRRAPGLAFFPARPRTVVDLERALDVVLDTSFEPRRDAAIEGAVPGPPDAEVLAMERGEGVLRVKVAVRRPSLLVLLRGYQPGFVCLGKNGAYPVVPANGAFMAVTLRPGETEVAFLYHPPSYRVGLFLSAIALLATLIMAVPSGGSRS